MGRGVPAFGGFIFFWLMFGGYWGSSAFRSARPWSMTLMSVPFLIMGLSTISWFLSSIFGKLGIEIDADALTYTRRLFFFSRRRAVPLGEVGECRIEDGRELRARSRGQWGSGWDGMSGYRSRDRSRSTRRLCLDVGVTTLRFGESLSVKEQEWLRDALNTEIRKARAEHRHAPQ